MTYLHISIKIDINFKELLMKLSMTNQSDRTSHFEVKARSNVALLLFFVTSETRCILFVQCNGDDDWFSRSGQNFPRNVREFLKALRHIFSRSYSSRLINSAGTRTRQPLLVRLTRRITLNATRATRFHIGNRGGRSWTTRRSRARRGQR